MSTKLLFDKIKSTFQDEVSDSPKAMASDPVRLIGANWDELGSAYREAFNDHVENGINLYSDLFNKVNEIHAIPKTLQLFNVYRDAVIS